MAMVQETLPWIPKTAHAVLSDDRKYRYVLYRSLDGLAWDDELRPDGKKRLTVCFVMLNPSQADENKKRSHDRKAHQVRLHLGLPAPVGR
jgi:hypothetical protein